MTLAVNVRRNIPAVKSYICMRSCEILMDALVGVHIRVAWSRILCQCHGLSANLGSHRWLLKAHACCPCNSGWIDGGDLKVFGELSAPEVIGNRREEFRYYGITFLCKYGQYTYEPTDHMVSGHAEAFGDDVDEIPER